MQPILALQYIRAGASLDKVFKGALNMGRQYIGSKSYLPLPYATGVFARPFVYGDSEFIDVLVALIASQAEKSIRLLKFSLLTLHQARLQLDFPHPHPTVVLELIPVLSLGHPLGCPRPLDRSCPRLDSCVSSRNPQRRQTLDRYNPWA